ncbi:MAG: hypothetical protein OXF75_11090 [Acidimicrobiaceae bacterium]|nr:hypothetical protein [Acidimicrobiaceae bacterium]
MSSSTRWGSLWTRLLCLLVGLAILAILREASIRRHIEDLADWPRIPRPG